MKTDEFHNVPTDVLSKLTQDEIRQLNELSGFLSFKPTWWYWQFCRCPARIILLPCGNQTGKTASVARSYVERILGIHPNPKKNLLRKRWRFCSATLPTDPDTDNEVRNTQYPALKRYLPKSLIKSDITHRRPVLTLHDPLAGKEIHGQKISKQDITIEFVSYSQEIQVTAGVQRDSVWLDEQSLKEFYEEQLPRLLEADGDMIITCTPADIMTWMYDELYERARWYVRTEKVARQLGIKKMTHPGYGHFEKTESDFDIAVFQAATDDNPVLTKQVIDDLFSTIDDPDVLAIRRYGIFKQVSGRVYKDFTPSIHVIDGDKWFLDALKETG